MTKWHTFGAVVASLGLVTVVSAQQQPTLDELLKRTAEYVEAYAPKLSGVVLDEDYTLIEVGARGMRVPQRISSHLILIDLFGKIVALRDVYSVSGAATRPRTLRISEILLQPSGEDWQRAQQLAEEGHVYFLRDLVIRVSEPTIALQYASASNQPKFRWRMDGMKSLRGRRLATLRFDEATWRDRLNFLKTVGNAASSGRLWLDPATGAIQKTELWLEAPTETVRIEVEYVLDPKLSLWLPSQSGQSFEMREPGGTQAAMGGQVTLRHTIEGTVKYSNPRYSPIDMTKISRGNGQ